MLCDRRGRAGEALLRPVMQDVHPGFAIRPSDAGFAGSLPVLRGRGRPLQRLRRQLRLAPTVDLVSLGFVMLAEESGAGRPNSAGGRNSRQGCEHLRTGGFAGICPHWHAKRGWHREEHPCHPLKSLKIGNSGAAFGSESPRLGPDLGQKGHATGKSFPCRATPQRQILNKTRGGTKGATFPPPCAFPPPAPPCLP